MKMTRVEPDEINLEHVFNIVEVESDYLEELIKRVLSIISSSLDIYEMSFDLIREGRTFSGEVAEVIEDGDIILDSDRLKKYDDDVVMAIIAHEFAHYYLDHYGSILNSLELEDEADDLARRWGFAIEKFRRVCGPATESKVV